MRRQSRSGQASLDVSGAQLWIRGREWWAVGLTSQFEQHAIVKFVCKLGKSALETLSVLQQLYGDNALKKTTVCNWFAWFKKGQETLEDEEHSGRASCGINFFKQG